MGQAVINGCLSATLEAARREVHRPDQFLMPSNREAVGHPGDEVADGAQLLNLVSAVLPPNRQQARIGAIGIGETGNDALGFVPHRLEFGQVVETLVEEALEL